MARKKNRLRDQISVIQFSEVKQPNGDIGRTQTSSTPYRCNATHRDTELIDRVYDVPQFKFDYVLRMRLETVKAAQIENGTNLTVNNIQSDLFQVVQIIEDSDRTARVFVVATN